jgi:hypothetical protein
VRRAVGVALEPNGQQLVIGPRVGVQRGQPVDLGTEDFGGSWRGLCPSASGTRLRRRRLRSDATLLPQGGDDLVERGTA